MTVRLHIERLILEGFDLNAGQRRVLQASAEAELARMLAEGGIAPELAGGGAAPRLAGSDLRLTGGASDPVGLGRRIAQSVYGGVGK